MGLTPALPRHAAALALCCCGLGIGGLAGCAGRTSLQPTVGAPTDGMIDRAEADADAVEDARRRRAIPAQDVVIEATLWDGALVAAALSRASEHGDDPHSLGRFGATWTDKVARSHTAFTVVIELANRPPQPPRSVRARRAKPERSDAADASTAGSATTATDHDPPSAVRVDPGVGPGVGPWVDPLVAPQAWSFALARGDEAPVAPAAVTLQGIDRFPTAAGGHHLRLAFDVVFAGAPTAAAGAKRSKKLSLRVRTNQRQRGLRRRELGSRVASRGAALTWWISPPA